MTLAQLSAVPELVQAFGPTIAIVVIFIIMAFYAWPKWLEHRREMVKLRHEIHQDRLRFALERLEYHEGAIAKYSAMVDASVKEERQLEQREELAKLVIRLRGRAEAADAAGLEKAASKLWSDFDRLSRLLEPGIYGDFVTPASAVDGSQADPSHGPLTQPSDVGTVADNDGEY